MTRSHEIKAWPESFRATLTGRQRFTVRRDDRAPPYTPGDVVTLLEFNPEPHPDGDGPAGYTGRKVTYLIGFVDRSPALPRGWCAFDLISSEDANRAALGFRMVLP